MSGSDLLHGLAGGNVATTGSWAGGGALELNDGDHGDSFDNIGAAAVGQIAWPTVGSSVTFNLGLGANGLGYDISSIQSIAAWQSAGFGNQGYTLEVQPVGGSFATLATVLYNPLGGGAGATKVTLTDDGAGPGGNLATGIEFIRLTQDSVPGTVGNRVTYRELDVFGTSTSEAAPPASAPEPSTLFLVAIAFASLIGLGRRRRGRGANMLAVAVVLSMSMFAVNSANAAEIFTDGFEDPDIAGQPSTATPTGWSESGAANASGMADRPESTEGDQHVWLNGPSASGPTTFFITLGEVVTAGTKYDLTVDVGQTDNFTGSTGTIRLYGSDAGFGTALAELSGIAPPQNGFLNDVLLSYTATPADATGQTLGIALIGSGGIQVRYDDLRLSATAASSSAPEPSTLILAALGFVGLMASRRRKR